MRNNRATAFITAVAFVALPSGQAVAQAASFALVENTPHNLSVSGPGRHRAATESQICVFCHTPHGAGTAVALWNRETPQGPYRIYQSSSLRANVGQPTGTSKLCLSCHDGTIALGHVLSRRRPLGMVGGITRLPAGPKTLGTDLSDDHPISFPYGSSLAGAGPKLLPPAAIPWPVKLDRNGEVQCTSCHLVHDNTNGQFLVRPNEFGRLCRSCHNHPNWPSSDHATSSRMVPASVSAVLGADRASVAENACKSCHRPHGAPGPSWLLHKENLSELCLRCHDGSIASDVRRENRKASNHGIVTTGPLGVTEGPFVTGDRISCADCHDSHAAGAHAVGAAPPSLAQVEGVSLEGVSLTAIKSEHELCFRCHGDAPVRVRSWIDRTAFQPNKRQQFQPTNPSFHPIGNPGVNNDVPSLVPPLVPSSEISCGDCHDSDSSRKLGGSGPAGPHGSAFRPLLARRYDTEDFSQESSEAYSLCYRCHFRDSILGDNSFKGHRRHIEADRTPCSICHDPHGISSAQGTRMNHSHLINFDRSVAFPSASGRLEFEDLGRFRGRCYLTCHGKNHDPLEYGR